MRDDYMPYAHIAIAVEVGICCIYRQPAFTVTSFNQLMFYILLLVSYLQKMPARAQTMMHFQGVLSRCFTVCVTFL